MIMENKQKLIVIIIIVAAMVNTLLIIYAVKSGLYLKLLNINIEYYVIVAFLVGFIILLISLLAARYSYTSAKVPKKIRPYAFSFFLLLGLLGLLVFTLRGIYLNSGFVDLLLESYVNLAVIGIISITFYIWYFKKEESKKSEEADK